MHSLPASSPAATLSWNSSSCVSVSRQCSRGKLTSVSCSMLHKVWLVCGVGEGCDSLRERGPMQHAAAQHEGIKSVASASGFTRGISSETKRGGKLGGGVNTSGPKGQGPAGQCVREGHEGRAMQATHRAGRPWLRPDRRPPCGCGPRAQLRAGASSVTLGPCRAVRGRRGWGRRRRYPWGRWRQGAPRRRAPAGGCPAGCSCGWSSGPAGRG